MVLADNGSVDGAPERAAAERDNVRFVPTGGNLGYGGGANAGVASLGDDVGWIVIANPDLEWDPGSIDALLEVAQRWPRGGAFGPLIREPDGTVYPSARLLPSLGRGIGHAVFGKIWPRNPWTRSYRQETAAPTRTHRAVGCPDRACCCAGRRSTPSEASTPDTSCTSRTSTSATG